MEGAPVTAATGALGPVIAKLAALLGSEYKLRRHTRRDVKFIRSKLKPVHSILWNIWEREELDEASKALKMQALDLADDVDDAIVDFILSLERSRDNKRLVQTKIKVSPFQDFKKRASDVSGRYRRKWKKPLSSLLSCGKLATDDSRPGKPRAYPFVRKDASELVCMARPRDKLIKHLVGEDERTPVELQLKTAFIYGTAGMGKSTLADLVYEAIGDKFQSMAFVSVTPGGSMREVLARILQEVAANTSVPLAATQASTEEDLIGIISNFLKDKRYLIIIDDIWNWREWEVIMKSLPENNLGSRVLGTTRTNVVAEKWRKDFRGHNSLIHEMLPEFTIFKGWVYKIYYQNIAIEMVAMKADLSAEGLNNKHPIIRLCGGTPLAVVCMLSALAREREKQSHQGLHAKACDVQDDILKHVMENGIQNTPGFEPLVESLELGFDALPHHMLKTCLLYCSIYSANTFERNDLVRRWISEGFVYTENEANGHIEELVDRGLILTVDDRLGMLPMLRNFLRWKSRQDNFITCRSEITPSYNTCKIRRLCIDDSPCISSDAALDPLSALDWYHIRSLIIDEDIKRVPFEKLEGVRVLDLYFSMGLQDHHLKDICGLVRLRHLLGVDGDEISEIQPEIVRLKCLETFEGTADVVATIGGFIGDLQQLKTLQVRGAAITELPKETWALQQLQTLRVTCEDFAELPREVWSLQQLRTLDISNTKISVLPKEVGSLQQLRILDISHTQITMLPKEIGKLQLLRTLDISHTQIRMLPKEIGKMQHLEHLLMTKTKVANIPREIGGLKELKTIKFDGSIVALPLEVCEFVELPQCIHQALKNSDLMSDLAGEMLSVEKLAFMRMEAGLIVGAKQMHIPLWIKEHFNDLGMLDIGICKLEEGGLKILQEMPQLQNLTLRFEVVPREPVAISSQGFAKLGVLIIYSRVPRVTFEEGAMPNLLVLTFHFQFYAGPPNKDPVGINHLKRLRCIGFLCKEAWYVGGDSPCIRQTIDVVRKEAQELPRRINFEVCGREETIGAVGEIEEDTEFQLIKL